ncbi:hypothetical protein QTP86_031728 [Hemibagrus guttatus]|nr:hypothetical protein QTP86_031728 [Hemibagrus guttatus]
MRLPGTVTRAAEMADADTLSDAIHEVDEASEGKAAVAWCGGTPLAGNKVQQQDPVPSLPRPGFNSQAGS